MTFPPWSLYILTAFALLYGWLLHRAALARVYRITGIRFLDTYILTWLLGLLCGYTPVFLYLAFGFKEFADTAEGNRLLQQLHWLGRAQAILLVLYTVFILLTVKQTTSSPINTQDIQQIILSNVIFAFIAILFAVLADAVQRRN